MRNSIIAELKHIAISLMYESIVDEAISFSEPERVRLNERMQERKDKAREVIYNHYLDNHCHHEH